MGQPHSRRDGGRAAIHDPQSRPGLAEVMAEADPQTAASLLTHVAKARSPITIVRGDARIPQEVETLFLWT